MTPMAHRQPPCGGSCATCRPWRYRAHTVADALVGGLFLASAVAIVALILRALLVALPLVAGGQP